MDPWDHINPYASSSGSKYGNPVCNLGTSNRTNANQTSRCKLGQADKSSQPTLDHSLSNAFQEGELNSRSAQGQWGKTNNYVGGFSGASIKNGTLYKKSEQPSSYTARCQWKNEEVPPSDARGKEESSYRSTWKNKYDCNSRNDSAERASGLPTETHLECRRSLFDIDYEAKTELQARDYHSGSNCDGLDYVGEIKSDYDNLPEIRLQERDHQDLREYYSSDKSDDDSSFEENYLVDIELAKRNIQLKKQHNCGLETQLRRKDDYPYKTHDVVVKTELDESRDLVVVKTEVEERPDFEETFDYTAETRLSKRNLSADWEYAVEPQPKKRNLESDKTHKHPNQTDYHSAWSRLLGERDDYSDSYLRNRDRHLEETDYSSHGLEMNDNTDNKKQPKKREESVGVRKGLMSSVSGGTARLIPQSSKIQQPPGQLPQMGKKTRSRVRPFRMKLPSGATLQLKKSDAIALGLLKHKSKDVTPATDDHVTANRWHKRSETPHGNNDGNRNDQLDKREDVPHTTDDNATKSRWDQKDNQDKNCYDKSNISSWSILEPLEKIKEVTYTTDDNTTESCWDKKYNHQDKSYHDKNDIWSFLGHLDKIKEGSHATDDTTESRWDKKDSRDKSYHDENNIWSFLGQLGKIKEVSHTTDDNATKSRWDQKYNHQDENYHDENNRNKKDEPDKREVSHTTDDNATKSRWDQKYSHQDENDHDENNKHKKVELEKRETVSRTADCVTKSYRDKKDNCQDKSYRDKNYRNKKDELDKREVSHTTDNYVSKSGRDNKDNHRKDDKNNRHKKNELEKRETVSHTADCVSKSYRDKKDNCQDKNRNKKDELDKRDEASHRTGDYVANSHRDKKDNRQDNNYRDKNNRNKKDELDKRKVSNTTKSCRDNKDNHRDKNYDKYNRNKKDQREKRDRRDRNDNCQDKNYRDKNNRNKKDELDKREEVSQTNDDYGTKSHRDKKENHQDNSYDKDNRNKKDQLEKREVSQRTDDVTKPSCDKRDNHQDKNCDDEGKDTVQKGLKIDIFAIKRELEEKIRKARMIKNSPAQLSDYSNVQSNPTAATLLGSRQCDSNGSPYTVTETVSENQNNFSNYKNPNFLLPGSAKEHYLQALGDKGNINYPYIWPGPGPAAQRKLEAQKAMERFLERIGMCNVINIIPFKSDCSVTSLRENLRIVDTSDKYWTHLAGLCYHIVQKKERLLKTRNINNQFDLVKEVQRHYSVLNAMILGKLDVADGPKHMQILRQWLQQSNVNSTMTNAIGFSFNYVFNHDSALEIDYEEVIKRFSNDRKLEISTMLHIGNDVCTGHGWIEHLLHHKSLYEAVILSNYSPDSIEQFEKNYLQLKENAAKIAFKHNTTYEISSKEESLKPNPELQQHPQGHNFPYVGQCNTTPYNSNDFSSNIYRNNFIIPNDQANLGVVQTYPGKDVPQEINQLVKPGGEAKQETKTQYLHCATGERKWQGERNNMHMTEWRKPRVAPMNTQLQHQSPPANLPPFPHAQVIEPSQPPHGVNFASVVLPCMSVPPPIMIPVEKNLDSLILVPATAYKLFEAAGYDFIGKLCEQTNLKIDLIKEQGVSTVQYICTLQGPDEEKLKAKAAIVKFCNGGHDVGS